MFTNVCKVLFEITCIVPHCIPQATLTSQYNNIPAKLSLTTSQSRGKSNPQPKTYHVIQRLWQFTLVWTLLDTEPGERSGREVNTVWFTAGRAIRLQVWTIASVLWLFPAQMQLLGSCTNVITGLITNNYIRSLYLFSLIWKQSLVFNVLNNELISINTMPTLGHGL